MKFPRLVPWRGKPVAPAVAAPAPADVVHVYPPAPPGEKATLKLGEMTDRLGHPVSRALLLSLGVEPAERVGSYYLYRESDWPRICHVVAKNALSKVSRSPLSGIATWGDV